MKTQDNSQDRIPKTAKSNIDDIMRIEQEFLQQRSFGDRLSDRVSALAESIGFIGAGRVKLLVWIGWPAAGERIRGCCRLPWNC